MQPIKKLAEKIDSLSLRERAMVFVGVIAVLFTLWDTFLIQPLDKQQKKLVTELNTKNAERLALNTRLQKLTIKTDADPNAANLERLKSLRSRLIDIQADLEASTDNLITPEEMPKVLETVLHQTGSLTLTSLRSLGATALVPKQESNSDEGESTGNISAPQNVKELTSDNIDNAYRHGLRIEFVGDYLTTLNYLKSLEELQWGFFWDNFELTVGEYPDATTAIEIFTLSLKQDWIGV